MFELAGTSRAAAQRASDAIFEMERRLAVAQLDNVTLRDPAATDHKYALSTLQKMTPHFDWTRYLDGAGIAPADLNVDQPEFMGAVEKELRSTPLSVWKSYLAWNVINNAAPHLSAPIAAEDFAFYGKYLSGST